MFVYSKRTELAISVYALHITRYLDNLNLLSWNLLDANNPHPTDHEFIYSMAKSTSFRGKSIKMFPAAKSVN